MDFAHGARAAEPAKESEVTTKRFWELPAFAVAHAPLGALAVPPIVILPNYFAVHLGVPLAVVPFIIFGARLFDIIIDPMIGGWQDATTSRFGRRRLWLALAAPPLMLLVWLVFIGLQPGANAWLIGGAMLAMYATYATMIIAHLGWAGELRADYHGRTNVLGAVQLAAMIGAMLILLLPGIMRQSGLGSDADAVHFMGWMVIVSLPICAWLCVAFVREPSIAPNPPLTWREQWDALVTNANLRHVLAPDLLIGIAQGVSGSLFLFYFQHVLGFETQSQTLLAIYFISGIAGVPIWIWLGHKIGKHRALQVACLYAAAITLMILLVPSGAFWIAAPMMAVAGVHQAANVLLLRAMMADVVDEDFLRCGAQRSGLFFGLILTTSKLGLAAGPFAMIAASALGYDPDLGARNTPQAMQALAWLFIGLTASIYLLSAWSLRFYKLDEARQRALRAEIDARSQRAQSQ